MDGWLSWTQRLFAGAPLALTASLSRLTSTRAGAAVLNRRVLVAAVEVALVLGCAYQVSLLAWTMLAPGATGSLSSAGTNSGPRPIPFQLPQTLSITATDYFAPRAKGADSGHSTTTAPETALNLELFGVRAGANGAQGSAIIRRPDGTQDAFSPGQDILDGVVLEQIFPDRVTIRRLGIRESLPLDKRRAASAPALAAQPGDPATASTAEQTEPTRRRIDYFAPELFAAIELTPGVASDGTRGLVMRARGDNDMLRSAGFEPGDVLIAVNGQSVADPAQAARTVASLAEARSVIVSFSRGDKRIQQRLIVDR
ncbi:MAG: type II secretion system protein N [Rhodospirillaceae bacterium]|nr:type II secretion system protein N [Rhodospirillaceae bacterium]